MIDSRIIQVNKESNQTVHWKEPTILSYKRSYNFTRLEYNRTGYFSGAFLLYFPLNVHYELSLYGKSWQIIHH